MKLMATAIVTLFAAAALATSPATAAKTKTETKTTTATAATTADTHMVDLKKACEGKMGEDLKKCETEFKKTHKK
jgi:hypothetical protein